MRRLRERLSHALFDRRQVHIWIVDLKRQSRLSRFSNILPAGEKRFARTFLSPRARSEYVVSRAAMRLVLARYGGLSPDMIDIRPNASGALEIQNGTVSHVKLSLSHCRHGIAIALTKKAAIGVDLEWIDQKPEIVRGVSRFFNGSERHFTTKQQIWECWCRKEALLKGAGVGISGLGATLPELADPKNNVRMPPKWGRWHVESIAFHPRFALACAVAGRERDIRVFSFAAKHFALS
jgi:phosphopantetheinyl transferase